MPPNQSTNTQQMASGTQVPNHFHNGLDSPRVPFINLGQVPSTYGANANNVLTVNSSNTGLVFAQQPPYAIDSSMSANTVTLTISPFQAAYTDGQLVLFNIANTVTGATTLNINGLGAKHIKKNYGGALVDLASGDLIAGQIASVTYDATNTVWQLEVPVANLPQCAFGVIPDVNVSTNGNTDTTVTTTFTPRLIKIWYYLQAHTPTGTTNLWIVRRGTAIWNGTTLVVDIPLWADGQINVNGVSVGSDQGLPNGSVNSSGAVSPNWVGTSDSVSNGIVCGDAGATGGSKATLTIASISSTSCVIRLTAAFAASPVTPIRANAYYEIFP